jgi:GNAT superfamily N-acetyltransferase
VIEVSAPVVLTKEHDTSRFDCGKEPLNTFIRTFALSNQASGNSRSYVALAGDEIAGYYSLTPSSVSHADAPTRVSQGLARHEIRVVLMARFSVDRNFQGRGIGRSFFLDAIARALQATEAIGGRAFLVHAKDEEARNFYTKFNMMPAPGNSLKLFMLFKDIRRTLGQ